MLVENGKSSSDKQLLVFLCIETLVSTNAKKDLSTKLHLIHANNEPSTELQNDRI